MHRIFTNKSLLPGFWLCEPTLSSGCPSTSPETGQLRCEVIAVPLAPPINKPLTAPCPFIVPPSWDRSPTGAGDLRLVTDFSWIIEFCNGKKPISRWKIRIIQCCVDNFSIFYLYMSPFLYVCHLPSHLMFNSQNKILLISITPLHQFMN